TPPHNSIPHHTTSTLPPNIHTHTYAYINTHICTQYEIKMNGGLLQFTSPLPPSLTNPITFQFTPPAPYYTPLWSFCRLSYGHAHLRTIRRVNGAHRHGIPAQNSLSC